MTLLQLRDRCNELMRTCPVETKVGVADHFGQLEDDFYGLSLHYSGKFIQLDGVSSKYPEPD